MITTAKQTEKKLLTYSALSTYRKCPMRYNLRYEKNLIPYYIDEKLFFGGVIHKALESWHGVTEEFELRKNLVLEKIDEECQGWEANREKRRVRLLAKEMMLDRVAPWIAPPGLPQIRACGHYRTRLLKILLATC